MPSPGQRAYSFALAVAPNSPGDGASDILFFASVFLYRSVTAGQTWEQCGDTFHADQHAFAFAPVSPPAGTIPATLVGCDGGIAASSRWADPSYPFGAIPADFDDGASYDMSSGVAQNYNHGKLTTALRHYHADPAASAIGYIACQDTGLSGHTTALGWRGLLDADGVGVLTTPGADGVKVWYQTGSPYYTLLATDIGDFFPATSDITMPAGNTINSTSNHVLSLGKNCITGANPLTRSGSAAIAAGVQVVTPDSMAYIMPGVVLSIDLDPSNEKVTVSSVTATTFTATFAMAHDPGAWVEVLNGMVMSVDQAGAATQISQVFGGTPPAVIAASPVDPTYFCLLTSDNRVLTTTGVTPGPGTVWAEAASGKPAGGIISWLTIGSAGDIYVLMLLVPAGSATPLYKISAGAWTAQPASGLPAGPFGPLVADPMAAGTMYAASQGRAWRLVLGSGTWAWAEVGPGLPGPPIQDLWAGNIAGAASPKVLLRAAVATRGMWEADVTAGATDPPPRPYVRDHVLDQGWLAPSPSGLVNPFRPADGASLFYYQCADIKIDAQQPGPPAFFQTDPEGTLPLSHVLFDQLTDNSQNLPGSDSAMVHVAVRARSIARVNNVSVWAIYASAAAGVPALNLSASAGDAFAFWGQFHPDGTIAPSLPGDSPWTAVGPQAVLTGIDAAHPQVASWDWTVPLLANGDPGHYCVVVFLHSAASPIGETTSYDVDSLTPANPQIGQKNLHIGPPLSGAAPGGAASGGGPSPAGGGSPAAGGASDMREYIEFHNPLPEPRIADLVFDLRPLPPELHAWLRLSKLETLAPLGQSLTGISVAHDPALPGASAGELFAGAGLGEEILEWLDRWVESEEDEPARRYGDRERQDGDRHDGDRQDGDRQDGQDDDDGHRRPRHKRHPGLRFTPPVYRAAPASLVAVRGVRLPAYGAAAALLVIRNAGQLPPGREYWFQVQQVAGGRVAGGSTYVVKIAGQPQLPPPVVAPSHQVDPKTGGPPVKPPQPLRNVAPWMAAIVEERAELLGKFPAERTE